MDNTKALEVAHEISMTCLLTDGKGHYYLDKAHAKDLIEAQTRAQLAEQYALIQKHLSTITELEAAVKERDAQLAAYKYAILRHLPPKYEIAQGLLWVTNSNGGWTTGEDITPLYRQMALELIQAYEATRQPQTKEQG